MSDLTTTDAAINALKAHLAEIFDLNGLGALAGWDQETYMPKGAAQTRAYQLSTLSKLVHQQFVSPKTVQLLEACGELDASTPDGALLRVAKRSYDKQSKLPSDFVADFSRDRALSTQVWQEARRENDFKRFEPHLAKMIEYTLRAAEYQGYDDHPYDALLDGYEPGMKTSEVREIFAALRPETVKLVADIRANGTPTGDDFLKEDYDEAKQEAFAMEVAVAFGYDLQHGRLDRTTHPFMTNFSYQDARITTRYDRNFLPTALFGVWHETGHGLYEQGTDPAYFRSPLARGASMMFHESQSRTWENLVGRSHSFWQHWYGKLQSHFPAALGEVALDTFYKAINQVQTSLIRVEADEVTYNLHIMLRFELELALMEGKLKASELPEAWNALMQDYLGLLPDSDAGGVMQDIHWSSALIGYFPTYTLGNILSAQLFEQADADLQADGLPSLAEQFTSGQYLPLREWQRQKLHTHGKRYTPNELVLLATGKPLSSEPYLRYLKGKFGAVYGI
jgi:carboxypeptidase Taq